MPRLFAALEIGAAAQDRVAAEQARLATAMNGSSLRWMKREQLHITLVFLGQVSDDQAASAIDALRTPIPEPPFHCELGGLGAFPPRGAPRALWIAVTAGVAQVIRVQSLVAERLAVTGVESERRPFNPHLTLARWRDSRPSDRPSAAVSPRTIASVDVTAVTLFQSLVTSAGSTYTRLTQCALRGASSR